MEFGSADALLAADPGPLRGAGGRQRLSFILSSYPGAGEPVRDGAPPLKLGAGAAPFFQRRYAPIMNFSGNAIMISVLSRRFSHKCSLVLSGGRGALFSQSSFKNYVLP